MIKTGNTPADGNTNDAEMIVPLKYLLNICFGELLKCH